MKLIPAGGSPRMQKALVHRYVRTIVAILLHDLNLLYAVTPILTKYDRREPQGLEEALEDIKTRDSYTALAQNTALPTPIVQLTKALRDLYQQSDEDIRYQRGAIVEVLIYELVRTRYNADECVSNHRFVDGKYASDQIDVAALSSELHHIEGYECKLKIDGIESSDCTNLTYLAKVGRQLGYQVHVGIVCLEDSRYMKRKFKRLQDLAEGVVLYGLDTIELLEKSPL